MADFDYNRFHSRSFYAPKTTANVKRGQAYPCHSKEDEARAREAGFTSVAYIQSDWPTTVYNKKTGESRSVGKLEWSDEQNAAAIAALGPDWGTEHVAVPEPKKEEAAGASPKADIGLISDLFGELKLATGRIDQLEEAISEVAGARMAMETRIADLEGMIEEASRPDPAPSKGKASKEKALVEQS